MDELQTIKVKQDTELGYKIIYLSDFDPSVDVEYMEGNTESEVTTPNTTTAVAAKTTRATKSKISS